MRNVTSWPAATALLLLVGQPFGGGSPAAAQLTVTGNQTFDERDFDLTSFAAGNLFGGAVVTCDFDGDGFDDLAIGSPMADLLGGVILAAGAVHVAYGGPNGLTLAGHQTLTQPLDGDDPPEEGDQFGRALAAGDFDGDQRCDLAVGAPFEGVGAASAAGSVHVFWGSDEGLEAASQVWTQDTPGVLDVAEDGDHFGAAMAAGDFDGDGFDDLAIAAPGEDEGSGVVHVLFGTLEGLTAAGDELLYEGDPQGTSGTAEPGDQFGWSLAVGRFDDDFRDDLAVGIPFEDSGGLANVGRIVVFYGEGTGFDSRIHQVLTQLAVGLSGEEGDAFGYALAVGDFDGNGQDDLAIGSPAEGAGLPGSEAPEAGQVTVVYGTPAGLYGVAHHFNQDTTGISDQVEAYDRFGEALAAADFDFDGYDDLAIGVFSEEFENSGLVDTGAVHALYGSPRGLGPGGEQFHGQGGWNVGTDESNDAFGEVLAAGDFDGNGAASLVVGVPREGVSGEANAGLVAMIGSRRQPFLFADGFESGATGAWDATAP
jgi:hypothetical protein